MSVLGKTLLIGVIGTFIALASLTASLPLPWPSHQKNFDNDPLVAATYPDGYDTGATAWMIVATIFGFFLAPALVYLYTHLYGLHADFTKTVLIMVSMISFIWVIFSFSLAYGQDANGDRIMGFPKTFYMFYMTGANSAEQNDASTIPNSIFAVFELGFALVTPTIVAASVSGRVNMNAFLIFIFAWHLTIYTPIAHITWYPTGWFRDNWIEDFSGGIVVHQLSAITALGLHIILGHENTPKAAPVSSVVIEKVLPSLFAVWFLWFGFTTGKAYNTYPVAAQSIVNIIAATTTSILMSFLYDLVFDVTTTTVSITMAVLIGLIAISPAAGFVSVGGAMCIAIFTLLVTRLVGHNVFGEGNQPEEPFSLLTLHGLSGTCGFFATAVFSYTMINPEAFNGLTYGRGIPLSHHIACILALWSCTLIAVLILAFGVNTFYPLAVTRASYAAPPATTKAASVEESNAVVEKGEAKQIELSVV